MKPKQFLCICAGILLPATGLSEVLSQDAFSAYSIGSPLTGQNPTINGYAAAWAGVANGTARPLVMADSLTYDGVGYVNGVGAKAGKDADAAGINGSNSGRVERLLDETLTVTSSTVKTVYLSWLFQTGNENAAPDAKIYQTLALWNGSAAIDSARVFDAGIASGDFATGNYAFRANNNTPADLGLATDANVHLFVAKFVLSDVENGDSVTVWIDPALGEGEPTGGVTLSDRNFVFDRLALSDYASNSSYWDEIRWGTTFDSVTTEEVFPSIPVFEASPGAYAGFVGDDVTLHATAVSSPAPHEYQWERSDDGESGWSDVEGATSSSLEFVSIQYPDRGYYRLKATNANGTATSEAALISLSFPNPVIVTQPVSVAVEAGGTVQLEVVASGEGFLSYQWYKNGDPLDGEVAATLELTGVSLDDEGEYFVEIADDAGEEFEFGSTYSYSNTVLLEIIEPWAGLVSHDPFDGTESYTEGALVGQNPAIEGYIDAWALTNGFGPVSPVIQAGSLVYADPFYLGSSGEKVAVPADAGAISATNSGRVGRLFEPRIVTTGSTTGTRYLSWLFRSGYENAAPDPQVYQTLALFNGALGTDSNRTFEAGIAVGAADFNTPNFAFRLGSSTAMVGNLGVPADGEVHLFVAKFELSDEAGGDSVTVWIDPQLGGGEPTGGVTVAGADLAWDRLALSDYASNSSHWDEVRWGSSFDSVTLNPNPPDPATFAGWIAGYPAVGSMNGFYDDADGDGIKNGLEYLFGTNPAGFSAGISGMVRDGNSVSFGHPLSDSPPANVNAVYKWSTDLVSFHAGGVEQGGTTVDFSAIPDTEAGVVAVTAQISGVVPDKLFIIVEAVPVDE